MVRLLVNAVVGVLMYQTVSSGLTLGPTEASKTPAAEGSSQATITQLRLDSACVTMLAGLSAGAHVESRLAGKGKHKVVRYYYKGSEINTFPEPAQVSFTFVAQCDDSGLVGRSFVIPRFVKEARFVFCWGERADENVCEEVIPSAIEDYNTVWKEGDTTESRKFTIPATGVKLTASLKVKIYSGDQQLTTISLRLPGTQEHPRKGHPENPKSRTGAV